MLNSKWLFLVSGILMLACVACLGSACQSNNDDSADDDDDGASADDDADGDPASGEVMEPGQSGCLHYKAVEGAVEETVRLRYANGVLAVEHGNTCRSCAWNFDGHYTMENGSLEIVEGNSSDSEVWCACFFNNSYEIPDLVAGPYHLTLSTRDLYGEVDVLIDESVDFSQQTDYDFSLGEHGCG